MIALLVACSGGAGSEAPVVPPPPVQVDASPAAPVVPPVAAPAIPSVAVAVAPPADAAALLAGLSAENAGKRAPITNELSGQTDGESVDLKAETEVFGVPCLGGDGALQLADGYWGCVLARDATVGSWRLRADTFVPVWYGTWQPRAVVLENAIPSPATVVVGGVSCQTYVHYRADGTLEACTLAAEAQGHPVGADVEVARDGAITLMIGD